MTKRLWVAAVVLLAGCESSPEERQRYKAYRAEQASDDCNLKAIGGRDCVVCYHEVYGGSSIAVSCDWSKPDARADIVHPYLHIIRPTPTPTPADWKPQNPLISDLIKEKCGNRGALVPFTGDEPMLFGEIQCLNEKQAEEE